MRVANILCWKAFKVGLIVEEETIKVLEMVEVRLKSDYAYQEEVAEEIYQQFEDNWKLINVISGELLKRLSRIFGACH